MHKRLRQYWWVLPLVTAAALLFIAAIKQPKAGNPQSSLISCTGAAENDFNCWRQRYETLAMEDSPKSAFADFRKYYEEVKYVKSNCHQIAHVIGRTASRKYDDVSTAYSEGDNFCWSGYYHGVIEGLANDLGVDRLVLQLDTICEGTKKDRQYSFYHYNCVHGLGHGLMVVYENELFTSLEMCDKLNDRWERESCHSGVFMENIMAEINPDHSTKYLKDDDPLYPCTAVKSPYKQTCYLMQTSHALVVVKQDYTRVFELCGTVGEFAATCYQSLGRDASGSTSSDITRTRELCGLGPAYEAQENCVIGAVKDFISYHHDDKQALAFCQSLEVRLAVSCTATATEYFKTF